MKKKIVYSLIALAMLAGVAIGHVTSQAIAGTICGINWSGGRADIEYKNDNLLEVMVYTPFKVVKLEKKLSGHKVHIYISK